MHNRSVGLESKRKPIKMFIKSVVFYSTLSSLLLLSFILQPSSVQGAVGVIGARAYLERVARRVVELLETRYITGTSLPIADYTAPINISASGLNIAGTVSFHSAFISKIGAIEFDSQRFKEILLNTEVSIQGSLKWHEIGVVLDFDADLEDYKGTGTLFVTYNQFDFPLEVTKYFNATAPTGSLKFMSIDNSNRIVTVGHPNNQHVQMISRAIMTSFDFRDMMILSFRNWNFQNLLAAVINDIPFPEVCYNC
uniref:Uncharacterized protein n=1 Tax=Anopheles atroparvus TaxID=41427 RepID=A0AAG5CZ78_ANOAO